jgi:DNA-binding FadR family transcriptional regulator
MWNRSSNPVWSRMDQHLHTPALRKASQQDHQRVLAALVARDPQAARAAMREHLERVITEFTGAWR